MEIWKIIGKGSALGFALWCLTWAIIVWLAVGWTWTNTEWNSGVNVNNITPGGGFAFMFPICNKHVNAIQTDRPALVMNKSIVIQYKIVKVSGNPKFVSLDPAPAPPALLPNLRPMLQTAHDDYYTQDNRWWPTGANCIFLAANMDGQVHEYRVQLKPNLWSNVYGKMGNTRGNAFQNVVTHPGKLNIVAGGGNSFSHGDCDRNGKVKVVIQSISVQ